MISRAHPAVNEQKLSMERLETIWRYRVGWKGAAIDRYQKTVSFIVGATCCGRAEPLWQRPLERAAALWSQSPTRNETLLWRRWSSRRPPFSHSEAWEVDLRHCS